MENEDYCLDCGKKDCTNPLHEKKSEERPPWRCPFCGMTDCKSPSHILKLYTLPLSSIPPKYIFLFRMVMLFVFLLLIIGGRILFLMLQKP